MTVAVTEIHDVKRKNAFVKKVQFHVQWVDCQFFTCVFLIILHHFFQFSVGKLLLTLHFRRYLLTLYSSDLHNLQASAPALPMSGQGSIGDLLRRSSVNLSIYSSYRYRVITNSPPPIPTGQSQPTDIPTRGASTPSNESSRYAMAPTILSSLCNVREGGYQGKGKEGEEEQEKEKAPEPEPGKPPQAAQPPTQDFCPSRNIFWRCYDCIKDTFKYKEKVDYRFYYKETHRVTFIRWSERKPMRRLESLERFRLE